MSETTRRALLVGLSVTIALPAAAKAGWPQRPITLIHGFPPGGPVDVLSRILAEPLGEQLGQAVIVEPKPGATGITAASFVARAKPDGYTLMAVPGTFTGIAAMFRSLPYNPSADFTFISSTAEYPLVLVTHPDSGLRTMADLIRTARERNTPLQYGTAGNGSIMHLTMELLAKKAGLRLQHIPYKGGMPAITDLIGKRIDVVIDPPTALLQFVKDGKLRALAVTGAERFFDLPDIPTLAEAGVAGIVVNSYQGIAGPAHLPVEITATVNRAIAAALAKPAIIEQLKRLGNIPRPAAPEAYSKRLSADIALWNSVVDDAHLTRI
jgi:tripartite-type tricarboxylate transporter receptor subunit TctC